MEVYLTLLGLVVGTLAGLLGIGGGIAMVPMLVFITPLLGLSTYSIHQATGIAVVSAMVSAISSVWTHYKKDAVSIPLVIPLSIAATIGGISGGIASGFMPALVLYILFAVILLFILVIQLFKLRTKTADKLSRRDKYDIQHMKIWPSGVIATSIAFLSANLGIGGSVILLPILISIKRVPVRLAIGTGACWVFVMSLSATLGKGLVGLIPMPDALWVTLGAFAGGFLGAKLSHRFPETVLKSALLVLIVIALTRFLSKSLELING